ncbi:hypothetical protein WJX72_004407 [[Myrmecia] bisecta]|uniref:Cilia- and flagella-associated protein 300 n=1 Tax=[Myrmecia] bisecta TaxID=41462 RepID=A0AAW1PNX9_9CHLO
MTVEADGPGPSFHFHALPAKSAFADAYVTSNLKKWGMHGTSRVWYFRYDKAYHKMQAHDLIMDLLADPEARQHLQVAQKGNSWQALSGKVTVDTEVIPATLTKMSLFDRLRTDAEPAIVRDNGSIVKCMEDIMDGFQVSDMLRDLLLSKDSENAALFSEQDTAQFLFRVFRHLCLGGAINQFEDNIEAYLDVTKKIYKELISVQKSLSGSGLEVSSAVYCLKSVETNGGWQLFPHASANNFCYITMDPLKRHCKVWYHAFMPFW